MPLKTDKIICHGFVYECELGFHPNENRIRQKIKIDLEVSVLPIPSEHRDQIAHIRLDYYKANILMKEILTKNKFNLVETVAEEIAVVLLREFHVEDVKISVTKYPLDMPNVEGVTYECLRSSHDIQK